jgi:two-component system nitrate/nitrite response regulator NarL
MVLAFTAGANAYLVSVATSDVFIKILELVLLGETILPTSLLNLLYANESTDDGDDNDSDEDLEAIEEGALPRMKDNGVPRFSARQRLILRYLIEGDANKAIARKIHLTEATVKIHVRAILRKIRVQNRTQAAIWAMNNGSFNSEKDNDSSPAPDLATEQIASPGRNSALPSPQGFKIGGARDGTGTGVDHVVQSRINSKYD